MTGECETDTTAIAHAVPGGHRSPAAGAPQLRRRDGQLDRPTTVAWL